MTSDISRCYDLAMFKRFFCILALILLLPVHAGEYEEALKYQDKVFLYLYSSDCGYCVKFDPVYKKLATIYGNQYKFVKINTDTTYGRNLAGRLQVKYVPFVLITNKGKNESALVAPQCITNLACAENVLKNF